MDIVNSTPMKQAIIPNIPKIPVINNKPKVSNHFLVPILKLSFTISVSVKSGLFEKTTEKKDNGTKAYIYGITTASY